MGTWNVKPFGNDAARDWVWCLEKARDEKILVRSLKQGLGTARKPASDEQEEIAVAAAAVVAAAATDPIGALPAEARSWVRARGFSPGPTLRRDAARLLRKIARASALRSRWAETRSLRAWTEELDRLADTLEKTPAKTAAARKPRVPSAGRLSLPKLIRRIKPAQQGPTRAALGQKLAALVELDALLPGEWQKTALHLLAAQGLLPEVTALVERGAAVDPETPVDASAATPFELACRHGHADVAEFLLARGARVFRQITLPKGREFSYPAALYYAVHSGDEATVRRLFAHSLDRHVVEMNGRSLLHYAAESDHPAMVHFLVAQGLKPDHGDKSKFAPLHLAVMSNREECVRALLEAGANPNAQDNEGASPLDFATEKSHRRIAQLLRQHGGVSTYKAKTKAD